MSPIVVKAGRGFHPQCGLTVSAERRIAISEKSTLVATDSTFPDGLLLPGLIDLHSHPVPGPSIFGIDPDREILPFGVTATLSQGDVGAVHLHEYLAAAAAQPTSTNVRLALNLSKWGESRSGGCFQSLEDADVDAAVTAIQSAPERIWGLSINISHQACPAVDPRAVLHRGLEAAERTGKPILFGLRRPQDWPLAEQLDLLRSGDVVTYCYRAQPHCLVERGRVRPEFREARERGVLFDVGHGRASFDFPTAEAAIADRFFPDTISTDHQAGHVGQVPRHTLPAVVSKLIAAGLPEAAAWTAVTTTPARILGIDLLGPKSSSDLVVVQPFPMLLADTSGQTRSGVEWRAVLVVKDGHLLTPSGASFNP